MKKILIVPLCTFAIIFNSAQIVTAQYGQKYIKNKNDQSLTEAVSSPISYDDDDDARQFADKIANASGKYVFLQEKLENSGKSKIFRYILNSVKDKKTYLSKKYSKEFMNIEFKINSDNNYTFSHIWGHFSDLFPIWKSLFYPNANEFDYNVSTEKIIAEWKTDYKGNQVTFGRLGGESWYIIMK